MSLDKSQSSRSSRPLTSRRQMQPHPQAATQVVSVSSQTTFLQAQPKLNPPSTASHYYGHAPRGGGGGLGGNPIMTDVHMLPQLVKGTQPLSASLSRESQHGLSSGLGLSSVGATTPMATTASTSRTGAVRSSRDSAQATPKSQRGCFSLSQSSASVVSSSLRPLGCYPATGSRRTSQSSINSAVPLGVSSAATQPGGRPRAMLAGGRVHSAKVTPRPPGTVRLVPTASPTADGSSSSAPAKVLVAPVASIHSLTALANIRELSPNVNAPLATREAPGGTRAIAGAPSTACTRTDTAAAARVCRTADEDAGCTTAIAAGLTDKTVNRSSADLCDITERVTPTGASCLTDASRTGESSPVPTAVLWNLTAYEEVEIKDYLPDVYCTGSIAAAKKIQGRWTATDVANGGYDDDNCHYRVVVGDHIGYRYEITKELGRGTFGVVVSAIDHKPASAGSRRGACTQVAIKLIKNKPAYAKQAKEEARLLDMLVSGDPNDEANIVRQLDTFTFRNHYAIVFELLQSDLYSYMQANHYRPFTQRFIFSFAENTLRALDYLSQHGIIHCDVKPENIVLDTGVVAGGRKATTEDNVRSGSDGSAGGPSDKVGSYPSERSVRTDDPYCRRLKLIDFGSSCTMNKRVFTYIQSRYYRAPEIVLGIPYTPAIDMWSFGCVLCELANGLPIFPASSEGELIERITEYLGHIPAYLIAQGKRVDKFFAPPSPSQLASPTADGSAPERKMLPGLSKKGRVRKAARSRSIYAFLGIVKERYGREEARLFTEFISECLTLDPQMRLTPREALNHPWMQKWRAAAEGSRALGAGA